MEESKSETTDYTSITDLQQNYDHQCYICDKTFSANSNLNRHLRKIHQENVQSPYNNVKCALCTSHYPSSSLYNQHLEEYHMVTIQVENLTFASKESFEEWKHKIEDETTSQFIKSRGEKKSKNVNKTYYSCNRSGYYVSKARTQKALKKQGSRKINGRCPASINVTFNPDSTYEVRFVKTHVGHDFELEHLDISDKDRDLIVQKLESGITKRDIIKQIRSNMEQHNAITAFVSPAAVQVITIGNQTETISAEEIDLVDTSNEIIIENPNEISSNQITNESPTFPAPQRRISSPSDKQKKSRLHLATTKDIHNIINAKHLDSKLIRHNYDLHNLQAWVNEMKDFKEASSPLFYKPQCELSDRFKNLKEEDFMLVIMRDGQAELLKRLGDKCIIIDSTYQVNCEYLQLTVISIINEDGKGLPIASLFSTRTNIDVLEAFFSIIKDKVGSIGARIMIADELNDFYHAWSNIMGRPTHNLLTPWSVFESWVKALVSMTPRDKIRNLKRSLRPLLLEANKDKFDILVKQLISDQDTDVAKFIRFFQEKYAKNTDFWSDCLRSSYGISNSQLWKLHDKFVLVYKTGKLTKKLCKFVNYLSHLHDENQLKELIEIEDKGPAKLKALSDRHSKSFETNSLVYEVAVEPRYWICPSEVANDVYYEVKRDTSKPDDQYCCDLVCVACNACRHRFKCTCLDYVVNLNMCTHIHRICSTLR